MKIFYIDEFGSGGMTPAGIKTHPCSALCAFGVAETNRISLANHIGGIKDEFFVGWKTRDWHHSEIKGRYLRSAQRRLNSGRKPGAPSGFHGLTTNTLRRLVRHLGLTFHKFRPLIYIVAVHKDQTAKKYGKSRSGPHDPVALAYLYLQQRASLLIEDVYGSDEGCLFVADEQGGHEKLFRNGTVHRLRQVIHGSGLMKRSTNFEVIFDKPLWVNKGELPADREILQLADVATYFLTTAICSNDWTDPWLTEWILPYVARHWGTGEIWDAGVTVIPRPNPYPKLGPIKQQAIPPAAQRPQGKTAAEKAN